MKNQKKIDEIEINTFIKEWLRNTNNAIEFDDGTKIEQRKILHFYQEFLGSFLKNRKRFKIVGADKMVGFEINIAHEDSLKKICQDIWDKPEEYYKIKDDVNNYYYDFLKFLWVEDNNGNETRLAEFVSTKTIS